MAPGVSVSPADSVAGAGSYDCTTRDARWSSPGRHRNLARLVAALAATRVPGSALFGVRPTDFGTFAGVATLFALVCTAAMLLPTWRATHVDPVVALRQQ